MSIVLTKVSKSGAENKKREKNSVFDMRCVNHFTLPSFFFLVIYPSTIYYSSITLNEN